jgi:hypothetical protein
MKVLPTDETRLVFIGKQLSQHRRALVQQLITCQR